MLISIFFVVVAGIFIRHYFTRKQHPPGPFGIPIFGQKPIQILQFLLPWFFPSMTDKEFFDCMKKKYGDIWSIDFGDKKMVVLSTIELLTEAYIDNAKTFSGRPYNQSFQILSENQGIIFSDGEKWLANRQLALKALRDLGMGKQALENQLRDEIDELIETLEHEPSKPVKSPAIFVKTSSNIIAKLNFSSRNKYNDPDFERYLKNLKVISHTSEHIMLIDLFTNIIPLRFLRRIFRIVNEYIKASEACFRYIEDKCKARIKVESDFAKPNCVLDFFWRYRYQDQPDIKYEEKLREIAHSMFDLFIGGTDTINNILGFCCLFLGKDRDLQNSLRMELQSLVDDHKLISMEMRKKCPKLLSFIDEVYRFCPLDSFFFRRAISDGIIGGYKIKKDDVIMGDISAITRNPANFDKPNEFSAYRFLDETRTKYIPNKSVIPFGIGKRACPGESIAVMNVFMILAKLLLKFDILFTEVTKIKFDKIMEGTTGLVYSPLEHDIIFKPIETKH